MATGDPGRSLSRTEFDHVIEHAKRQPPAKRRGITSMINSPAGRARLRAAGYTRKPPQEVTPTGHQLAGQPVDVVALVAGLRQTERGRAALRARGLE